MKFMRKVLIILILGYTVIGCVHNPNRADSPNPVDGSSRTGSTRTQSFLNDTQAPLSDADKIVGLSKCWSEAKYNFVYFDKLPFDWDSLYHATIPAVLATQSKLEYYRELQRFVACLKDGHTRVRLPDGLRNDWAAVPLTTKLIDGKMIVTSVLNDTLEQEGIKAGTEIIKINEMDVHEYVSTKIKPYIDASTGQWLDLMAYGRNAARGKKSESILMTFKDSEGKIFERSLSRSMSEKPINPAPVFDFRIIDNNTGFLKIRRFWGDDYQKQFDSIYPQLLKTDALIIDVRENGGGNSNNSVYILSHLTKKSFKMSKWSSPRYIPAHASWNRPKEWHISSPEDYEPAKRKTIFDKPVVLLISEGTFSAAEDFCVGFRNMKRGQIIGTPSGGSTGNPIVFRLPGGGSLQICTKKDTYPDGAEFVGIGILPDIEVKETVLSYLSSMQFENDNSLAKAKAIEILTE
jgi:C-terminal processing protease CtpA/Prc